MKPLLSALLVLTLSSCSKKDSTSSISPQHKVVYMTYCPSKNVEVDFYNYVSKKDSTVLHADSNFRYEFTVPGNVDLKTIGLYVNVYDRGTPSHAASAFILVDDTTRGDQNAGPGYASAILR